MSSESCIGEATSGWRVLRLGRNILVRENVTLKSMLQSESTKPQSQTMDVSTKPRKAEPGRLDSYARVLSLEVRLKRKNSKCWNPRQQHSSNNLGEGFWSFSHKDQRTQTLKPDHESNINHKSHTPSLNSGPMLLHPELCNSVPGTTPKSPANFPHPTPASCTSTPAPRRTFGGTQIAGTRGMERKRPVLLLLGGGS